MKNFTIVARPNYQDPLRHEEWKYFFPPNDDTSLRIRLRASTPDPLEKAFKELTKESDEMNLIHPNSPELSTVCIWAHENKYYVKSLEDTDCI